MDINKARKYLNLMKEYDLSHFSYKSKDSEVIFKKEFQSAPSLPSPTRSIASLEKTSNSKVFLSPLVGVFYQSSSPKEPAFVKVKQKISKDTILCIIESMKVMNEIQADFEGEITEILVSDGESIEYNQALFKYQ